MKQLRPNHTQDDFVGQPVASKGTVGFETEVKYGAKVFMKRREQVVVIWDAEGYRGTGCGQRAGDMLAMGS